MTLEAYNEDQKYSRDAGIYWDFKAHKFQAWSDILKPVLGGWEGLPIGPYVGSMRLPYGPVRNTYYEALLDLSRRFPSPEVLAFWYSWASE